MRSVLKRVDGRGGSLAEQGRSVYTLHRGRGWTPDDMEGELGPTLLMIMSPLPLAVNPSPTRTPYILPPPPAA